MSVSQANLHSESNEFSRKLLENKYFLFYFIAK